MPLDQSTLFSTAFQSIGSMITYLKRYAYCAILGIVADEDDDANAACGNQVEYNNGKQAAGKAASKEGAGSSKAGVNGAQLKCFISDINDRQSIDELMAFYQALVQDHPELRSNQQLTSATFQKASSLGIEELKRCHNLEETDMLIERWNEIWPAVIAANTPFGNAVANKRNSFTA